MSASLVTQMPGQYPPFEPPLSASPAKTSDPSDESAKTQLSSHSRAQADVSSVSIDRRLLSMASAPPAGSEGMTDAEFMLRAKACAESHFDYLDRSYRRPLV